jgi:hypothetical protein
MNNPDTAAQRVSTAIMYVTLSGPVTAGVGFDGRNVSANFRADGWVWNTESKFKGQRCQIGFYLDTTDRLMDFAHKHGLKEACGSIQIEAGLEPQRYEDAVIAPIQINMFLDDVPFFRMEQILRSCLTNGGSASASVTFAYHVAGRGMIGLDDINLSSSATYAVASFAVNEVPPENTIVSVPRYSAASIRSLKLKITDAHFHTQIWRSKFSVYDLTLSGSLSCRDLGFEADNQVIEIKEYELSRGWREGYPEEAFPGLVRVSRQESATYCWVELYATNENLLRLTTLLSGLTKDDTFEIAVSVIADDVSLAVGEQKQFHVASFTPFVTKALSG